VTAAAHAAGLPRKAAVGRFYPFPAPGMSEALRAAYGRVLVNFSRPQTGNRPEAGIGLFSEVAVLAGEVYVSFGFCRSE
jgi:hypothetical protein